MPWPPGGWFPRGRTVDLMLLQERLRRMSDTEDRLIEIVDSCLRDLAAGDDSARHRILEACDRRLRALSHRLLGGFRRVRRWDDTDDVSQNAAIRLYRALGDTVPASARDLLGLMALQIQRELLDLARKHAGPTSFAANHETNVRFGDDGPVFFVEEAAAPEAGAGDHLHGRWEAFHAAVESLPPEQREVFRLVWYLGLEQDEAATTLGCSSRTVRRHWKEAKDRIRAALDTGG